MALSRIGSVAARAAVVAAFVSAMVAATVPAAAQVSEVELDHSPAEELYIRKRPTAPEAPAVPDDLQPLLLEKGQARDAARTEAIGLLEQFLATRPTPEAEAEALFKLAELLWEDARRRYVLANDEYERELERCRRRTGRCERSSEPRLDFSRSETLYKRLVADHPDYRRTDLVLYLVGFAAREAGRYDEALDAFRAVIERFPRSPLYGDAWMLVGEHHFALGQWREARVAYQNVLERPDSPSFDLALFKTAWSDWKLGEIQSAAARFKRVLDLAAEAERSGTEREKRRRSQLRDEALDYLVLVFTEDESIGAREVYDFLASIGGAQYSRDVLLRLGDLYESEGNYARAVGTWRFLIEREPAALEAAAFQRQIVAAQLAALDDEAVRAALTTLAEGYGPASDWARENQARPKALARSLAASEALVRKVGESFHGEAQRAEKQSGKPDRGLYERAEATYGVYLDHFGDDEDATRVRFLRAEILLFQLGQPERAGDQYLAVGKTSAVGEYHKDALLKAMAAYEKARPRNIEPSRRGELLDVDRKFAEATDLYATLFPADPEIVSVIFRNGQLFYDYGDYDEAVKRFGLIVTRYPDHADAGAAGDRILDALNKGEDYENVESWARKLKDAKAFSSAKEQSRLDRIIVEAIGKSGEKYASGGHYDKAARFYLRIPKEYPEHALAPQALFNAAVMLEKAKQPEQAAASYVALVERFPRSPKAETAAFTAGQAYEDMAYFDRAAEAYELSFRTFPRSDSAPDALFNAGVLRQVLGDHKQAIRHYEAYANRFKDRKDAEDVAFRVGVVYEEAGDDGRADLAYRTYTKRYRRGEHLVQAHTRAGRAARKLGQSKRAAGELRDALAAFKTLRGDDRARALPWAAEARYLQGELVYEDYAAISLDVPPRKLKRTLDRKSELLGGATTVYLDVVELGDPAWSTASLYRMGRIYEEFATAMQEAPPPKALSADEQQVYRDELDNYIIDIEEHAIELYTAGYAKALQLEVYNQYTRRLREALTRMARSQYPPEREARDELRIGDRPPEPALIEEVIRDE